MDVYGNISRKLYEVSILILGFFISILVVVNTCFFVGITINFYTFLVCLVITSGVFIYAVGYSKKTILSLLIFLGVMVIAIITASYVIDTSYDGNSYHKMAIGLLKNGWNPVKESCAQAFDRLKLSGDNHELWIDHYANGEWVIAAVIYALTGRIESGKAFNILSMFVLFGILNYYLCKKNVGKLASAFISIIAAFSPVMCSQMFTYYNDGVLAVYIMICVLALFIISDDNIETKKISGWFVLAASIIICGNIKFTGLAYVGFFSIGFYVLWLVRAKKDGNIKKKAINITSFFIVTVIITVVLVGFTSYIQNLIEEKNPLYPLIGPDKVDIMSYNQTEKFSEYSNITKLLISTFSKTEDLAVSIDKDKEPTIKVPFTISKDEIRTCMTCVDTRIGGFGPLFGGISIITIAINIAGIVFIFKKNRFLAEQFIVTELIMAALLIFMEGSWWARYSGYAYMLVIFALLFAILMYKSNRLKVIKIAYLLVVVVNTSIMMLAIPRNIAYSYKQHKQYRYLREVSNDEKVKIAIGDNMFTGFLFNLSDYEINYDLEENDGTYETVSEQCAYKLTK